MNIFKIIILVKFCIIFSNAFGQNNYVRALWEPDDISLTEEHWERYKFDTSKIVGNTLIVFNIEGAIENLAYYYNKNHLKSVYTFFENGVLQRFQEFDSISGVTGKYLEYYKNGDIHIQGNYLNGKRVGLRTYYFESGAIKKEIFYKNGKKNGPYREYYENGQVSWVSYYRDNLEDGFVVGFYEMGNIEFIYYYENFIEAGIWYDYYENGVTKETTCWDNKNLKKIVTHFDSNGNISEIKEVPYH
ncbi:MAG: toxin-antitoxin system YwqK family antitoxin [Bacteroidales bacterium]|nr:toxin-antitoxin system YwqK family antitoxin [Bacteroidales bacterium]